MQNKTGISVYRALLIFANMSESNRQRFISAMNEFLMVYPQDRSRLIEQWHREHGGDAVLSDGRDQ